MQKSDHEARVEAFMAAARKADPLLYAAICRLYPVKTARQLRSIAEKEILVGASPEVRDLHGCSYDHAGATGRYHHGHPQRKVPI